MTAAEVTMTLPAESRFVATARVTTASLAAELDYSIDEIEDLRVGVNELVAIVMEWAEDHDLEEIGIRFVLSEDAIEVVASAGDPAPVESDAALDALTAQILASVVDEHDVGAGRGRILKRRAGV